ncbi:MAG TPA: hypothetical protein VFY40_10550, partial [Blastocatellia bacterium]|nr:hypothetical protein [Blastocatellia bacterium]
QWAMKGAADYQTLPHCPIEPIEPISKSRANIFQPFNCCYRLICKKRRRLVFAEDRPFMGMAVPIIEETAIEMAIRHISYDI